MKVGVYFCTCGTNISEKIDPDEVRRQIETFPEAPKVTVIDFICSEDGKAAFEDDLREYRPDRVVVAACSPREHETTFRRCLANVGMNPYFLQVVNLREQNVWVTEDPALATTKAIKSIRGAVRRVQLQQPLEKREIETCPDALVIGAGPAGLKAALALAEAGRSVVLVERSPAIGGLPVRFEELFPAMECAPCMLEPVMGDILHGEHAERIELLTMAEVEGVTGFYGNFNVTIRQRARQVSLHECIGCGECVEACPASLPNPFNCGMSERKAIDFPYAGALPNAPYLDAATCVRSHGEECHACKDACPMGEQVVDFDEQERQLERRVGAIILATGSGLYDCSRFVNLGYGAIPDVHTSFEFERILSSTGPTGGELLTAAGAPPASFAIIHCVGSLDEQHCSYCSGVCCQYAFKFNHLIASKLPEAKTYHFHRELVLPGKEAHDLYHHAASSDATSLIRYRTLDDLAISRAIDGTTLVTDRNSCDAVKVDMVVLCPAVVPADGTDRLAALLDVSRDNYGFFRELHGRLDVAQSTLKGVYLAGTCQEPMDIQRAMLQGMAAAGYTLSGLVPGRTLEIEPICAEVNPDHCSGCRVCVPVCPYHAVSFNGESGRSEVNAVLCHGCGTCVAACPAGAMSGHHFTNEQIMAEIEGVLQ